MSRRLQLAVNARPLLSPITGIARYLLGLMREVERSGGFAPDYFYATHWSRELKPAGGGPVGPDVVRMIRSVRLLSPLIRTIQRRNFAAGLRRGDFALYFEPCYLPFDTPLPTVITVHDLSHLRHPETHPAARVRQLEQGLPPAVDRAACILTVSEYTRREVIAVFGVNPDRVVATPLGVEARFYPRPRGETAPLLMPLNLTHGRYFLAVGTLEPRKNVLMTLEAHSRLPDRVRGDWPLVVAGMSGWLTETISRRLELARSRGQVKLLGHVSDDQLPSLYAGAAMLSYPSIYEGFGLPPLEAMASGVPVAASDRASLPEVVGDAGILLEPDDIEGLTSVMLRIIEDAAFANDLRARGLERARRFTWQRCAYLTMQAWQRALAF
jgi:glycosyltransferase involved in cell wall biosynthesis